MKVSETDENRSMELCKSACFLVLASLAGVTARDLNKISAIISPE